MSTTTVAKTYACPECGDVPLNHTFEKIGRVFDVSMRGFFLTRFLFNLIDPRVAKVSTKMVESDGFFSFLNWCVRHGILGVRTNTKGETNTRVLALYEGAEATGVTLSRYSLFDVPLGFVGEKNIDGKLERVFYRIIPRPKGFTSPSLAWMDDKGILKQKMKEADIPHADGGTAKNYKEALAIFKRLGSAVIIKPYEGSRGRHTTLDIRTEAELKRALDITLQITTSAVVEKYLHGTVHRVTLVGGKPVAVAKREYPHVIGDGVHTVDELIDRENENPLRHGPFFRPLDKVYRVAEALERQNLTHESIPEKGKMVILGDKNSRLHGTVTEDVTDSVHPDNTALFERFGTVLGDPIVGVDFMIGDITRSWKEQPESGVLECNSMPFIDVHHQVISGKPINVAAHLWNVIFPEK